VSENTEYVTDLLKRYVSCNPATFTGTFDLPANALPIDFVPDRNTLSSQIHSTFVFRRGGVNYKLVQPVIPTLNVPPTATVTTRSFFSARLCDQALNSTFPYSADGAACLVHGSYDDVFDISVPYNAYLPYMQDALYYTCTQDPTARYGIIGGYNYTGAYWEQTAAAVDQIPSLQFYTSVRDDYCVGFLHFPSVLFTPPTVIKPSKKPTRNDPTPVHSVSSTVKKDEFVMVQPSPPKKPQPVGLFSSLVRKV